MPVQPLIRRTGSGPDLVMVHGWGMNPLCWGALAERLAASHTLHLVHLPGHGGSMPGAWLADDFVAQLLDRTPPAPWLGWSLGGTLALAAALRRPHQVSGLVLLSVNPCFLARPGWPHGAVRHVFDAVREGVSVDAAGTLERFLALMVRGSQAGSRTLAALNRLVLGDGAPDSAALLSGLEVLETLELAERLQEISCPALWVTGERDLVTPPAAMITAAARMPGAKSMTVPGAGHALTLSHPEPVLQAVRDFLAATPA